MFRLFFIFFVVTAVFFGCNERAETHTTSEEPQTSFGKAVHSANDLNETQEEKNEEFEEQAEDLFSEN